MRATTQRGIFVLTLSPAKNKTPLLSVILPTYNIEKYLHQCLDSVVNQTYPHLEIIIIDDNSADSTPEIIKEYAARDGRIKTVFHTTNAGPGPTRNEGLKLATGDYVTLMDHDDWQALDKYGKMMAKATEHNADIVFCNAQEYNQTTGKTNAGYYVLPKIFSKGGVKDIRNFEDVGFLSRILFPPWAKIVRNSLIQQHGIQFSENENRFDDVLYHFHTCLFAKRIYFIDEILYTHRMFPLSISGRAKHDADMMFDLFKSWDDIEAVCLKNNIPPQVLFVYYIKTLGHFVYTVNKRAEFAARMNGLIDKYNLKAADFPHWQRKFYYRAKNYSEFKRALFMLGYPVKQKLKTLRKYMQKV